MNSIIIGLAILGSVLAPGQTMQPGYGNPDMQKGHPGYGNPDMQKGHPGYGNPAMTGAYPGYKQTPSRPVPYRILTQGTLGRIATPGVIVIQDQASWQRYWVRLTGDRQARPPLINWKTETVLAVHSGSRSTAGYRVAIEGVNRISDKTVRVDAVEFIPPDGAMLPQVITSPYAILRVAKLAGGATLAIKKVKEVHRPGEPPRGEPGSTGSGQGGRL